MYSWEKSLREQKQKKHPKSPSFSSILLDEIFRSIDGDDESYEEMKHYKDQPRKRYPNNGGCSRVKAISKEPEEMASLKDASLMEKLMERKINDKVSARRRTSSLPETDNRSFQVINYDPMFFSTSSSSSDSSSGGLSSSDAEFYSSAKSRTSCFSAASRPKTKKPLNVPPIPPGKHQNPLYYGQSECCNPFDDYPNLEKEKGVENLIKSKSMALKIYSNLKKVKQPISPGGRLSSFINSLFTTGTAKKSKNISRNGGFEDPNYERKIKSTNASTCSSASSSVSRSCLSKSAPDSRAKFDNVANRIVRFYPVSVILDEDSRPCGHKSIYDVDEKFENFRRPQFSQGSAAGGLKPKATEKSKKEADRDGYRGYQNQKRDDFMMDNGNVGYFDDDDEEDEDDAASDCSSDLFEIDHLALFGNKRFCDELPVYETTRLDRSRAMASGRVC